MSDWTNSGVCCFSYE